MATTKLFTVTVPAGVSPGDEIQVRIDEKRMVPVKIPPTVKVGESFTVKVEIQAEGSPVDAKSPPVLPDGATKRTTTHLPPPNRSMAETIEHEFMGGVDDSSYHIIEVVVPEHLKAGQPWRINVSDLGITVQATAPKNRYPGQKIKLRVNKQNACLYDNVEDSAHSVFDSVRNVMGFGSSSGTTVTRSVTRTTVSHKNPKVVTGTVVADQVFHGKKMEGN